MEGLSGDVSVCVEILWLHLHQNLMLEEQNPADVLKEITIEND